MSSYYKELQKFNIWLQTQFIRIKAGEEIPRDNIIYDACVRFAISEKAANKSIDRAIKIEKCREIEGIILSEVIV